MLETRNNTTATSHRIFALVSIPGSASAAASLWSMLSTADQAELANYVALTAIVRSPVTDLRRRHSASAAAYVSVVAEQDDMIPLRGTAQEVLNQIFVGSSTADAVTNATLELYLEVLQ